MEYYQAIQNRAAQTAAVILHALPDLSVGGSGADDLRTQAGALNGLAQQRDNALGEYDQANNAENQGFLAIQSLVVSLPLAAEGELDDHSPAESALLDLLAPVYAVKPRTTEQALERGHKLVSALASINTYLAGLEKPRPPITSGGRGLDQLIAALAAQPALEQLVEDRAAAVTRARSALRIASTTLDRLNKRCYSRLQSEARTNGAVADGLKQILTESAHLPATLGIRTLLQGGTGNLQVLLSYDNGSYDGTATNVVEWQVVGTDGDFTHHLTADPSGNALGPFARGSTVKIRTRVSNANGTTTGSPRALTLV